jgi:hypothetical protein
MGADLILYWCPDPSDLGLSHEQARARIVAFAQAASREKLEDFIQWYGQGVNDLDEAYEGREEEEPVEQLAEQHDEDPVLSWGRRHMEERLLDAYHETIEDPGRDMADVSVGGATVLVSGGMSHGDEPTDSGPLLGMLAWSGIFDLPSRKGVLDLSTAHVPEKLLDEENLRVHWRCQAHEHGWIVFLGDKSEDEEVDMPEWFKPILKLARASNCLLVNFDKDGDVCDFLPVYP